MEYLTELLNLSVANADIPSIWKQTLIFLVVKPGKPAKLGTSYRPISLLCPAAKILERLLLPEVSETLKPAEYQHGFRPMRSTVTALLPITSLISEGFNHSKPPKRMVLVALDLSKAFNSVDITLLLEQIASTDLNPNIVRWIQEHPCRRASGQRLVSGIIQLLRVGHPKHVGDDRHVCG
jgi:hypothetical protein